MESYHSVRARLLVPADELESESSEFTFRSKALKKQGKLQCVLIYFHSREIFIVQSLHVICGLIEIYLLLNRMP